MILTAGNKIKLHHIPTGTSRVCIVTRTEVNNVVYYRTNIKGVIKELSSNLSDKVRVERLISVCDRCVKEANPLQMSMFNTQMCCNECLSAEEVHPDYERAHDIEFEEVRKGNYNYPGVGLPKDLSLEEEK